MRDSRAPRPCSSISTGRQSDNCLARLAGDDGCELRTKVSNTAAADTYTHMDIPGRPYAVHHLHHDGRASLIRQRSVIKSS